MSDGDDGDDASAETDDGGDAGEPAEAAAAPTGSADPTEDSLRDYLDEIADRLDNAETEADLDEVDALLDDAESEIEAANFSEQDADADDDEDDDDENDNDEDDPLADLADRVAELRDGVDDARGPYGADVVDAVEAAAETVADTEWTAAGRDEVTAAVRAFRETVDESVDVAADGIDPDSDDGAVAALNAVAAAVADADLDPDDDAETIAALLDATDALEGGLDDAEEWDDLETHEQLRAEGYYDVLGHYKDFPVEWAALKEHERRGNVDMILLALDSLQSEFMQRHCLEAFERMGKRGKTDASVAEMLGSAERRDEPAIRVLGKMAAAEATETLVEYAAEDSNPQLQKATCKALGEIGAAEAVQPLANRLDPEGDTDELVRPHAARALGLVGDTRAVDPLVEALADDPDDDVRAAAGWALRQIGTREALEAVAERADARSFLVATEAEKAQRALDEAETGATT